MQTTTQLACKWNKKLIFDVKMKILNEFLKQKTQLHDENDPEGLKYISI